MQQVYTAESLADRHEWLLLNLAERKRINTNSVAELLGVSVDTIRRDLRLLHSRGLLRRVHGGAVPISRLSPSFNGRADDDSPDRARLADALVQRFEPGQIIGLDAGTTTTHIAAQIPQSLAITIVTNNPAAAVALADHANATVVLVGGDVDLRWMATTGPTAVDAIRSYQLDISIVGVCSFDATNGASTRSRSEVPTKQAFIASAADTYMPVEINKLGTVAPFRVATPHEASVVVLEDSIEKSRLLQWQSDGIDVITA